MVQREDGKARRSLEFERVETRVGSDRHRLTVGKDDKVIAGKRLQRSAAALPVAAGKSRP